MVSRNRRGNTQGDQPIKPPSGGYVSPPPGSPPARAPDSFPTVPAPARARTGGIKVVLQDSELAEDDDSESETVPAPADPVIEPKPRSRSRPRFLVAGLSILVAVAAAGFWLRALNSTQTPQVVAGTPTVFHPANPVPPPNPVATTTPKPPVQQPIAATTPPETPDPAASDKTKKTKTAAPSASALSRALRKQRPKLEACFLNHSVALEGHATTQLMFDLAADGSQTNVELSPKLLTQTALGQCLLNVARSTRFPPQARALSFTIPLTASTSRE
jgi:hypothetical protein